MTDRPGSLHLRVITARGVVVDADVDQVTAEAVDGSFTMLPRHVDVAAPLVPGLLAYVRDGREHLVAVDGGVLVKRGRAVEVATPQAAEGETSMDLQRTLRHTFADLDERERASRTALARLEHDVVTRLIESREPA